MSEFIGYIDVFLDVQLRQVAEQREKDRIKVFINFRMVGGTVQYAVPKRLS